MTKYSVREKGGEARSERGDRAEESNGARDQPFLPSPAWFRMFKSPRKSCQVFQLPSHASLIWLDPGPMSGLKTVDFGGLISPYWHHCMVNCAVFLAQSQCPGKESQPKVGQRLGRNQRRTQAGLGGPMRTFARCRHSTRVGAESQIENTLSRTGQIIDLV